MKKGGKLIIFSAPSGSGKTTIVKHLLNKFDGLVCSVSASTRQRRMGRWVERVTLYWMLFQHLQKHWYQILRDLNLKLNKT